MRKPCNDCPWRKDAPPGYWHPDHFNSIWKNCQDDGVNIMLCHKEGALPEEERGKLVCQGWIRVMQSSAIGVRLALMRKLITIEEARDTWSIDLHETFEDMMRANGLPIPARNVRRPT